MSVICETSQSSIWASQQLLLLTHSTTFVFSVALSVNTIASASGVAIARRSGWRIAGAAKLLRCREHPRDSARWAVGAALLSLAAAQLSLLSRAALAALAPRPPPRISLAMSEILEVMAYASVGAALGEALSWLLVYRKPEFERLTQQIDAQQKKIDKQKEKEVAAPASKSKQKKVGRDEKEMGKMSRDLAVLRMRQQLVTAVLHVLAFAWFATHYDGRPLARLPFVPFEFVQKLSRRGLTTANPSDCSIYFLYSLCMMSLKPNLQKALGFAPPSNGAHAMHMAQQMQKKLGYDD